MLLKRKFSQILDQKKKIEVLRHKIRFVGKIARIWKIERENKELILNLKQMCPDGKIPAGTLIKGREGLTDALKAFMLMKDLDKPNEAWQGPRRHTIDIVRTSKNNSMSTEKLH